MLSPVCFTGFESVKGEVELIQSMSDPFEIHRGEIPTAYRDILEKRSFGHLATNSPSGWPQNSPVWVDHEEGRYVLANTLAGRRKERNLRRDPRTAISVIDPDDPYRYLVVRGKVTLTEDGASEHIDLLARKYLDVDEYPHHDEEDESRVIIRIPAERVIARGRSEED